MGNTATLFAFLQKRPESAELISGIAGTRTAWKETRQTESFLGVTIDTGKRTTREVEEFNVHPNVVKSLGIGICVKVGLSVDQLKFVDRVACFSCDLRDLFA